jgi:uncharacterized low-complexity protein
MTEHVQMKKSSFRFKPVATLVGSALLAAGGVTQASLDSAHPFAAVELDGGYLLAAKSEAEGKCGEGKCGAKDEAEGKCGEGKCGAKDEAEGKCGEGKCGAGAKDEAEGKCGAA